MNKLQPSAPKKVLQVRYRNPRGVLELFWAKAATDVANFTQFDGCKIMRALHLKGTGLYKNYAQELSPISIPASLMPAIIDVDEPEWWSRSREEANKLLGELEADGKAQSLSRHIAPFTDSLTEFMTSLPPDDQARLSHKILSGGGDLDENFRL